MKVIMNKVLSIIILGLKICLISNLSAMEENNSRDYLIQTSNGYFQCRRCSFKTAILSNKQAIKHLEQFHLESFKTFSQALSETLRVSEKKVGVQKQQTKRFLLKTYFMRKEARYKCTICGAEITSISSAILHVNTHFNPKTEEKSQKTAPRKRKASEISKEQKQENPKKIDLKCYEKLDDEETPEEDTNSFEEYRSPLPVFSCDYCDDKLAYFFSQEDLDKHKRKTHALRLIQETKICPFCGENFEQLRQFLPLLFKYHDAFYDEMEDHLMMCHRGQLS